MFVIFTKEILCTNIAIYLNRFGVLFKEIIPQICWLLFKEIIPFKNYVMFLCGKIGMAIIGLVLLHSFKKILILQNMHFFRTHKTIS